MESKLVQHVSADVFNETYIQTQYSDYAMQQVQKILDDWIQDQAVSRAEMQALTIDGATSLDLDDAIWAEKTQDWYCVWIHISDVSEAIPIFSPLDIEALHRTTSIYRKEHILDMIPSELSNNALSLDPIGGKKLTVTLQIDLDNEGKVKNHSFYESRFTNLKRYDYESFWEDFVNPEAQNYSTLQLFKEISDKLRTNRIKSWWLLDWSDTSRKMQIWSETRQETHTPATTRIAHDIIESLMVLANGTTWQHLVDKNVPILLKRHDSLDERSYYHHKANAQHRWLAMVNYTHFTSPIRRYVDLVIHRIIKALQRGEEIPYTTEDMKFIGTHSNNTRWKIETLGAQTDLNVKGQDFMSRMEKRLWRPLEVFDMKVYIRNTVDRSLKLPKVMMDSILELIKNWKPSYWTWALWIILLGKDDDLKLIMKERILQDWVLSLTSFLNILTETQILVWEGTIFEVETHQEAGNYSMKVLCKWVVVAKSKGIIKHYESMSDLQYACRKDLIENLFDYYINIK